eukprot:563586-Amphidinium_carterae.1
MANHFRASLGQTSNTKDGGNSLPNWMRTCTWRADLDVRAGQLELDLLSAVTCSSTPHRVYKDQLCVRVVDVASRFEAMHLQSYDVVLLVYK